MCYKVLTRKETGMGTEDTWRGKPDAYDLDLARAKQEARKGNRLSAHSIRLSAALSAMTAQGPSKPLLVRALWEGLILLLFWKRLTHNQLSVVGAFWQRIYVGLEGPAEKEIFGRAIAIGR